jgi:hypothetical protein
MTINDTPPAAEEAEERWARLATGVMCLLCGGALGVFALWDAFERLASHGRQALWSVAIQDAAILAMAALLVRIGLHTFRKKPKA